MSSSPSSVPILVEWPAFLTAPATADVSKETSAVATLILDTQSELGEGIVYDDLKKEVVWCDILGSQFHRLVLETGKHAAYPLPLKIGSLGLLLSPSTKYDGAYLIAWENGFQIVNPSTMEKLTRPSAGESVNPHGLPTRLNDGRCDPLGKRYICGGYFGERDDVKMKVFAVHWADPTEKTTLMHEPVIEQISVTNSLSFAPDGKTMYFADSPTKQIYAYDYNGEAKTNDAVLSNKRLVYEVELEGAVPDGSCVDSDGYIWNATWWGGLQASRVRRIDPKTGKVVFEVNMPDGTSRVSCCCFGGPDLDILFITTAGEGKDAAKEPHAGGIYAIKLAGVKGKLEHRFQV